MKKKFTIIILIIFLITLISGCVTPSDSNKNTQSNGSITLAPDSTESPIQRYFTKQKIIWTFDDYWIHFDHHPPHKGFDGLSQQINGYGGYVNIMCIFIPPWICENYGYEIRNYSVINEFSIYHPGFAQNHVNLSLEFFKRDYIFPQCHGWNHSADLGHANLSFAYKIVNYTLWNLYNNYNIKPNFWLGHGSDGNYNISFALKKFSEKYWNIYGENFRTTWSDRFPNGIDPAVEYIGASFDPYFGCTFGHPCETLQEAKQLFTEYSKDREIIFIRGHPNMLNDTSHQANLSLWQDFIDWIYNNHDLININHTQAIGYKIDRNNFRIENNNENYTIDLTSCKFNHNVLFSYPANNNIEHWTLYREDGTFISKFQTETFLLLEKGNKYFLTQY